MKYWFVSVLLLCIVQHSFSCQLATCNSLENCPNPNTEDVSLFNSVCLHEGTEKPHSGKYDREHYEGTGVYYCACCGHALFPLSTKFDSGTGWPSFFAPLNDDSVSYKEDSSCVWCGTRVAVECAKCGIHLGHVFDDGPAPTNYRYCMNSVCLHYGDAMNESNILSDNYFATVPKFGFTTTNALIIIAGVVGVIILGLGACVVYKRYYSNDFARLPNDEGNELQDPAQNDGQDIDLEEENDGQDIDLEEEKHDGDV